MEENIGYFLCREHSKLLTFLAWISLKFVVKEMIINNNKINLQITSV